MPTDKPVSPDFTFAEFSEITPTTPEPGLIRRVGAYNEKLFLAEHRMAKGWVGQRHSHPHEQIVYVVRGHLRVTIGQETFDVRAGDSFVVRGGVEHQASAPEESLVIDVFTPRRDDYV
jgi:quercetin dioxygenase-like cupin family protein